MNLGCLQPRAQLGRGTWLGVGRQEDRLPWGLLEVEVRQQIAEDRHVVAHRGPRVGSPVGRRVEPLPVEEVVLDELVVRVKLRVWWSM